MRFTCNVPSSVTDMAVKYFHLAEALYYRILESIIEREKMILGDADLSVSKQSVCVKTTDLRNMLKVDYSSEMKTKVFNRQLSCCFLMPSNVFNVELCLFMFVFHTL